MATARTSALLTVGFVFVVLGLTFSALFSAEEIPLFRDTVFFFVPFKQEVAESFRRGELALWNPHLFLGMPLLANLQTGVFYPLTPALLLPLPFGFNLFLLLHYAIALAGILVFFVSRGVGWHAAALGALTFVIGGYSVSMLNVTNFLQSFSWTPWILVAWSRHLDRPSARTFAALSLVIAVQTLAGGIELNVMTLTIVGAWTVVRTWPAIPTLLRREAELAFALGLAVAVSAAQVLPTAELMQATARGGGLAFAEVTQWSMSPVSLLQLLLPHSSSLVSLADRGGMGPRFESSSPWIATLYFGLVPLIAAIAGAASGRERAFWGLAAAAGVILALGDETPIFGALYTVAPWLIGKFRFPEKLFFFTHVAVAVLAAEGTAALLRGDPRARRAAIAAALTFLAVLLLAYLLRTFEPVRFTRWVWILAGGPDAPRSWIIALATDVFFKATRAIAVITVFAALFFLNAKRWVGAGTFAAVLVGLAAADLGSTHHDLNLSIQWSSFERHPTVIDVAELRQSRERIFHFSVRDETGPPLGPVKLVPENRSIPTGPAILDRMPVEWGRLYPNSAMYHGVGMPLGGEAFRPRTGDFFMNSLAALPLDRGVKLLSQVSVRYLLGWEELEDENLEPVTPPLPTMGKAFRLKTTVPRAYLAGRLHAAATDVDTVNRIIAPEFTLGRDAVVERIPDGWSDAEAAEQIGSAEIERYENERVAVRVRADRPAMLVLNDSFFAGWHAKVDGRDAEILRANHFFRGVLVEAGVHRVEFDYRPMPLRIGMFVSGGAILVLAALWMSGWGRKSVGD